jgi:hypothetical protein
VTHHLRAEKHVSFPELEIKARACELKMTEWCRVTRLVREVIGIQNYRQTDRQTDVLYLTTLCVTKLRNIRGRGIKEEYGTLVE